MNFYTVFLPGGDEHVAKDVGQIPLQLARYFGYNSYFIGCNFSKSRDDIEYLKTELVPLRLNSYTFSGILYIVKHAKEIDILNLYHTNIRVLIHSLLYKFLNPKGIIYIKLDCGIETCDKIDKDRKYQKIFLKCLKKADLITIESNIAKKRLYKYSSAKKIKLIPNGFSTEGYIKPSALEKQKIILTVALLSHNPKGTDLLIKAFHMSKCYESGWKLVLVGQMDDEFKKFYDQYLFENPYLKKYIEYKGFISNRKEVNSLYRKAAIFALPSYNENFSIAACEALSNGCYLILSDRVSPYKELTCNGKFGKIVKTGDEFDMCNVIKSIVASYKIDLVEEIVTYAIEKFSWESIIPRINSELEKVCKCLET